MEKFQHWVVEQAKRRGPPIGRWLITKVAKVIAGIVVCNLIFFGMLEFLTATNIATPQMAAMISVNAMGAGLVGGYVIKLRKKAAPVVRKGIKRARKSYRKRKSPDSLG